MTQTYVRLNPTYDVIIRDNSNFLVNTETSEEQRFISPEVALVINYFQNGYSLNQTAECLSEAFNVSVENITMKLKSLLDKMSEFIQISERTINENGCSVSNSIFCMNVDHLRCNRFPYGVVKRTIVPQKIVFNITDYCPRECVYCFNGAKCVRDNVIVDTFLSLERFEEVLVEAKKIGVQNIEIGGGDPFICKDIVEYLSICDKYFPHCWGTSTKAYVSKKTATELSKLSTVDIQISLDSFDENISDTLMGVPGSYRQVLESFSNLLSRGIIPSAKMVITSLNCHLIKDSFIRFASMGIKTIRANTYMMSPNRHFDYLYPTNEQIQKFNEDVPEILSYAKNNGINTDISMITIPSATSSDGIDGRVLCGASSTDMYIRHDGSMIFCGQINNCEDLVIGNLKVHSIMDLWQSEQLSRLFNPDFMKDNFVGTKCYACHDYLKCYPKRCYVRSHANSKKFFDVDPACVYGVEGYINRG